MNNLRIKSILVMMMISLSVIFLVACSQQGEGTVYDDIQSYNSSIENIVEKSLYTTKFENQITDDEEDFVESSLNDFKSWNTATVSFEDGEAIISNDVEDTNIFMNNGDLIVNSTKKLTLIVSGALNGSIHVNKPDGKFQLILNGVSITSTSGPAINLQTEKRSFLVINDDTINHITDVSDHPLLSDNSQTKAAIFSEEQLIISGHGTLNVTGLYRHGITSDDYIKIRSGQINIVSAVSDGLHANDYIVIDGGQININANKDGIEAEKGYIIVNGGEITIDANNGLRTSYEEEDQTINAYIQVNHGIININAFEKGITSMADVNLTDGAMVIQSNGDSIASKGSSTIVDGVYSFISAEKQVIDSDMGVTILGGQLVLLTNGDEHVIKSDEGAILFNGGTIVAAGAYDIHLLNSTQGYIKCGYVQENELLDVRNNGSLMTIGFINQYNHVVISSDVIETGVSYELYAGGSIEGDNLFGLFINGTYSEGVLKGSVIAD